MKNEVLLISGGTTLINVNIGGIIVTSYVLAYYSTSIVPLDYFGGYHP